MAGATAVALMLLGAGAATAAAAVETTPQPMLAGGNAPLNEGAGDPMDLSGHNSPVIARSPTEPETVVVANRLDNPDFACALYISTDGGASFSRAELPLPDGPGKCYAPDVGFGPRGRLYALFTELRGDGNRPHAVWLATSEDAGQTWSEPTEVAGPLAFQAGLTVHPDEPGRVHVTWLQAEDTATLAFPETGYPIQLATSDDGGRTWSEPATVSDPARERVVAPNLKVGRGDALHLLYLDLGDDRLDWAGGHEGRGGPPYSGEWELVAARSTDGGTSWTETTIDTFNPTTRIIVFLPDFPALAVDRQRGRVYAAFHARAGGDADVMLWRSPDAGATWSQPVRVNDPPAEDGTAQYLPQVAVAPTGRVDVVYYDRRDDPDNVMNEVSLATSRDAGASFTDRLVLSDEPFDSRIGFGGWRDMADLGARLALLSTEQRAMAVWADTRAGTQISEKQDLVHQVVAIPSGPIDPVVQAGLGYGGAVLALAGALLGVRWWTVRRRGGVVAASPITST